MNCQFWFVFCWSKCREHAFKMCLIPLYRLCWRTRIANSSMLNRQESRLIIYVALALHIKAIFGVQNDTDTSRYIQTFRVDVSVLCLNVRVYFSALLLCMQSWYAHAVHNDILITVIKGKCYRYRLFIHHYKVFKTIFVLDSPSYWWLIKKISKYGEEQGTKLKS